MVRITIDVADDAYAFAEAIARERNVGLGHVISKALLSLNAPSAPVEAGIGEVDELPRVSVGRSITSEDVRAILDKCD